MLSDQSIALLEAKDRNAAEFGPVLYLEFVQDVYTRQGIIPPVLDKSKYVVYSVEITLV